MHNYTCTNAGEAMEFSEGNVLAPEEAPLWRLPRDLNELLLWHQKLALGPDYIKLAPEDMREEHRDDFELETHMKWNQLVEYFSSHLIQQKDLESAYWRPYTENTEVPCAGEDVISANNMSLRSIAMCRVHKSLKHLSRLGDGLYFANYRVQRPILDRLPIPRNIIEDLIFLWDKCLRHRNFCGFVPIGVSRRSRILACSHKKIEDEDVAPICKKQECRMYYYLRRTQCWHAGYNRYLTEPHLLSYMLETKLTSRGYPSSRLLRLAKWIGLQTFHFSE